MASMWPSTVLRFAPIVTTDMWLPPASRHAAISPGHWLSPRLYRSLAAEGHEIAAHGFRHEDVSGLEPGISRPDIQLNTTLAARVTPPTSTPAAAASAVRAYLRTRQR